MFSPSETSTAVSTLFSAYASFAASTLLIRSMTDQLMPQPLRSYLYSVLHYLFTPLSNNLTLVIDEVCGMARNQVYDAAEVYLGTKIGPAIGRLRVSKTQRQKNLAIAIEKGQEITDQFDNFQLKWRLVCFEPENQNGRFNSERRSFELTFHKKFKDIVVNSYLPYVLDRANQIKNEQRVLKLYNRDCPFELDGSSSWGSINLEHPATFETLAIDHELKKFIIEDLDRFVERKEFYRKVGKAWKRGYLLYGPPGTGKSSLIAAMANYLKFDIYDLELTSIFSNSDLRSVLLSISNRSILVVEDVDCSVEMQDRQNGECLEQDHSPNTKLTLSGLLNFTDGLWSSCGDERIVVFTTNHKEKLDPALLRPGRMDVHINMSYCSGQGFKLLASNYLGLNETCQNPLYQEAQVLIETTKVTPAEVAEELMKSEDSSVVLEGLTSLLKRKKIENEKVKDERVDQTEGTDDKGEVLKAKKPKLNTAGV